MTESPENLVDGFTKILDLTLFLTFMKMNVATWANHGEGVHTSPKRYKYVNIEAF